MTTPSDDRVPEDAEETTPGQGASQQDGAPGVEIGLSEEGSGGTFEPEEDVAPEP